MNQLTLAIPERISEDFGDPIRKLSSLVQQINASQVDTIVFDFTKCKFSNPLFLGGVTALSFGLKRL